MLNNRFLCYAGLVALLTLNLEASVLSAGPEIFVENEKYDFGAVYREDRDSIDHTFIIQNIGDEDLRIDRIKPSCGCTRAEISRKVIPPGESAELFAELHFKVRVGRNQTRVTVVSNDPKRKSLDLGIVGETITRWSVVPPFINAGVVLKDTTTLYHVNVVSQTLQGDQPIHLKSVESLHPKIAVRPMTEEQTIDRKEYKEIRYIYAVEIRAGSQISSDNHALVRFHSDSKRVPPADLNLEWTVEGDLTIRPRSLSLVRSRFHQATDTPVPAPFEGLKPIRRASGNILVVSRSGSPFRIVAATAPEVYQTDWNKNPGSKIEVQVRLVEGSPGRHDGNLVLETDRPEERFLTIRLSGEIDPPEPFLSSSPPTHHFGAVFPDEVPEVSHTFVLRNAGTKNLHLTLVDTTGGKAALGPTDLPPGATSPLILRADLRDRKGPVEVRAVLQTNDTLSSKKTFRLVGEALARWEYEPEILDYHSVKEGQAEKRPVLVRRRFPSWKTPAELDGYTTPDGEIEVQVGDTRTKHTSLGYSIAESELWILLHPKKPAGSREGFVVPKTSGTFLVPPPPLPIRWWVMGDLGFRPRKVLVKTSSPQEPEDLLLSSGVLKIYSRSGKPFRVTLAEAPEGIQVIETERGNGWIRYRVEPDSQTPIKSGEKGFLVFKTDRPDEPVLRVEVEVEPATTGK